MNESMGGLRMDKVSVLIPARNEKYLEQTIRNVLANAEGEIEVLVALDGWIPEPAFDVQDSRAIFYTFEKSIGQRAAINFLANQAKGRYIMKLDAHCAVDKGFDVKLADDCEYDWTVIPRMYNLDVETWKPKLIDNFHRAVRMGKLHDYISMGMNEKGELRTMYITNGNVTLHKSKQDILIDDTMSCMGCCFFMHKDRFWELGGCDENHEGGWGQQAVEVACKAWLSGGSLKVNKKTWFAHWFRGGGGLGFPYSISGNQINRVRRYSTDLWLNDKWDKATRKFQWMIDKFNPPGWRKKMDTKEIINKSFEWRSAVLPWYPRKGKREDLIKTFNDIGFKTGVEVGTREGYFAEFICKTIPDVKLTCIDPWEGNRLRRFFPVASNRLSKYGVNILRKRSLDAVTSFKDGSLDFVYIDGNHDFDYVMRDIIEWMPKLRSGGVMACHDFDHTDVRLAIEAYVRSHAITTWYRTRELSITAFWVKE